MDSSSSRRRSITVYPLRIFYTYWPPSQEGLCNGGKESHFIMGRPDKCCQGQHKPSGVRVAACTSLVWWEWHTSLCLSSKIYNSILTMRKKQSNPYRETFYRLAKCSTPQKTAKVIIAGWIVSPRRNVHVLLLCTN